MSTGLVLLENSASSDKVVDKDGKARPPEVALHDSLSTELSKVT